MLWINTFFILYWYFIWGFSAGSEIPASDEPTTGSIPPFSHSTESLVYKDHHQEFLRLNGEEVLTESIPPYAPHCIPTDPEECSPQSPRAHQKCSDSCLPRPHSLFQGWSAPILIPVKWTSPVQIKEKLSNQRIQLLHMNS